MQMICCRLLISSAMIFFGIRAQRGSFCWSTLTRFFSTGAISSIACVTSGRPSFWWALSRDW